MRRTCELARLIVFEFTRQDARLNDLHVRTTAKLVLEVIGNFNVRDCGSGGDALLAARNFYPDLILLDIVLPELDGLDTLKQLRRLPHLAATPCLFVTRLTTELDMARYLEAGAIGVIPKALAPLRLSSQLRSLWDRRTLAPQ